MSVGCSVSAPENVVVSLYDDWSLERRLGSGSQGEVWLARARNDNDDRNGIAAVKLLKDCADARREVAAFEQLRKSSSYSHPHVMDLVFGLSDG